MDPALLLSMQPAPRRSHPTRSEGRLGRLRAMHAENRRQADARYRDAERKYNRKRGYEWKWLGPNNPEGVK